MEQFEQNVEQERIEDDEKEEERERENETEAEDTEASISEADAALFSSGNVIGMIEIEALDLKYPIVEGADSKQLAYGIGIYPTRRQSGAWGTVCLPDTGGAGTALISST